MVRWKITPEQEAARKKKEALALAQRKAALAHLKSVGQTVDETSARVGTGAASRSALSKSKDNTVELIRQRRARELQAQLEAAKNRLKQSNLAAALLKQRIEIGSSSAKTKRKATALTTTTTTTTTTSTSGSDKWETVKDKKTGKMYWWNRRTNSTSWVNPMAAVAKRPALQQKPGKDVTKNFWVIVQVRQRYVY